MTKNEAIDIVHKTILGFFDVVADDSEEPMNEKDKLLLEVNKAVCNAIKDMPDDERKTGWIPVTERLPEDKQSVLVWCPQYKNIYCAYLNKEQWWIFGAFVQIVPNEVVAWMPLPKPYEGSETDAEQL